MKDTRQAEYQRTIYGSEESTVRIIMECAALDPVHESGAISELDAFCENIGIVLREDMAKWPNSHVIDLTDEDLATLNAEARSSTNDLEANIDAVLNGYTKLLKKQVDGANAATKLDAETMRDIHDGIRVLNHVTIILCRLKGIDPYSYATERNSADLKAILDEHAQSLASIFQG